MFSNVSTKGKKNYPFLNLKICCEQPSFRNGMGSSTLKWRIHEEHNDTYYDLPSTLLRG